MRLHLHFNHKLEKSKHTGHRQSPVAHMEKTSWKLHHSNSGQKGSEKGNRHLMVQAQLGHHLSRQQTPAWTRDKGLTVTEISACILRPLPMLLSSVYIAETWWGNSFHPEWQSRLRSLLCCSPASSNRSSALAQDLPEFISRHVMQHQCFPFRDPTAGRVLRCDQGFFGVGCCITAWSGRFLTPLSCKACVVEIFG